MDDALPSKKFKKRGGTTDRGKDYEHLYIVNLLLKLSTDPNIKDFQLSSNDENFGAFDDVVVEIDYNNNQTTTYAIQLKHKAHGGSLNTLHFTSDKNFKIDKYLKDYEENLKNMKNPLKMIIFTNRNFSGRETHVDHEYKDEKIHTTIKETNNNPLFNTSPNNDCFSFKSPTKYKDFFDNFFLYAGQANVDQLEKYILNELKTKFLSNQTVYQELVNVIIKWSMQTGEKVTLNKSFTQTMLTRLILSPHIKTLTFSDEHRVSKNGKILRKAFSEFQVTTLKSNNHEKIQSLWADVLTDDVINDLEEINKMYQIVSAKDIQKDLLMKKTTETNMLLWLLGKCPLVLENCIDTFHKIQNFDMFKKRQFVLLSTNNIGDKEIKNMTLFQNLTDLKKVQEESVYAEVLSNFMFSVEGQKAEYLQLLLEEDQNLSSLITTDKLVQMIDSPLQIGQEDDLPPCHISRKLTKILIDMRFLQTTNNNLILVSHVMDTEGFRKNLRNTKIDGTKITFNNNNNVVYINSHEYNQEEFTKWGLQEGSGVEGKKYHQFRYLERESCLEWIRSKKDVQELQEFRCDHKYNNSSTHESKVFGNDENNINIICADSGMGKTTLGQSLKKSSSSLIWTYIIHARNLKSRANSQSLIEDCLKQHKDPLDIEIFNLLVAKMKVRIIWDGLDEVGDEGLKNIYKMVQDIFATDESKQWITSRKNLNEDLEKKFETFTREIKQFTEEQQLDYIQERLDLSNDDSLSLVKKIKENVVLVNNDVLGIPLQIYMLSELFSKGLKKYVDLLEENRFTILNLYKFFVEEKFNIYFKEKVKYDLEIEKNKTEVKNKQENIINSYKRVAFNFYFKNKRTHFLASIVCSSHSSDPFLKNIKNQGDVIGFISKVNDNNEPQFSHNSYGEYFAALYLFEKDPQRARNNNFIINEKFKNIRFFLDLMLSDGSVYHRAVLYKNYILLPGCQSEDLDKLGNIDSKDQINRSVIELSCAWNRKYPLVDRANVVKNKVNDITDQADKFLNPNNLVKKFDKFRNSLHKCVKNLLVFLPFLVDYYNPSYQRFDEEYVLTVLYYVIKFDYAVIFTCEGHIEWLQNIHTKLEPKLLMSLIMTFNARNCLQELIKKKNYAGVLVRNFDFSPNTPSVTIFEFFSILNQANDNIAEIQSIYSRKAKSDIQDLLTKCLEINSNDAEGRMLTHYACEQGNYKTLTVLISNGAKINVPDASGYLPIHYACKIGHFDIVKSLLEHDDSVVNSVDKEDRTPIHYACERGNRYIVQLLLDKGAKANVVDAKGRTPLNYISQEKNYYFEDIKLMLQNAQKSEDQ